MYIPILIIIMYVVKLRGQLYCLLRGTVTAYHSQHACILVKTLHAWSYIHVYMYHTLCNIYYIGTCTCPRALLLFVHSFHGMGVSWVSFSSFL